MKKPLSELDVEIGTRLKLLRNMVSLSQAELAKKTNISVHQLQNYELGYSHLSCVRLFSLLIIMGFSIEAFFTGFKVSENSTPFQSSAQKALYEFFQSLPEEQRERIAILTKAFKK